MKRFFLVLFTNYHIDEHDRDNWESGHIFYNSTCGAQSDLIYFYYLNLNLFLIIFKKFKLSKLN